MSILYIRQLLDYFNKNIDENSKKDCLNINFKSILSIFLTSKFHDSLHLTALYDFLQLLRFLQKPNK